MEVFALIICICFILWDLSLVFHIFLVVYDAIDGFVMDFGVKKEMYILLRDFGRLSIERDRKCPKFPCY